jgi:LacI family transcriptional regulator
MAVTIKDVARAAGVSASTACRALSSPALVSASAQERVVRAANELDYQPNRAARGLITGRTGNLGMIVPDLANPFFPGVVKGMQAKAREAGYAAFLADSDEDPALEATLVKALAPEVDGIVLCSPRMSEANLRSVVADTPLVLLNRRVGKASSVTVDNAGGMRQVVAHLTAFGHRRIAYVGGPRGSWNHRERLRALRSVTAGAGVELVELGNVVPQFEGGVAAADLVLAAGVTAVIAYNDLIALGILNRFNVRGVAVPAEISVVGCDDIVLSAMGHPALTTVALPMQLVGRAGVDLLLHVINSPDREATSRRELPTQLMVRGSTGPACRT